VSSPRCTQWRRVCSQWRGPCALRRASGRRRQQRQRGGQRCGAPGGRAGQRGVGCRRGRRERALRPRGGAGPKRKRWPSGWRPLLAAAAAALAGAPPVGRPPASLGRAVPRSPTRLQLRATVLRVPAAPARHAPSEAAAASAHTSSCACHACAGLTWMSGAGTIGAARVPHPARVQPRAILHAEQQPGRGVGGA